MSENNLVLYRKYRPKNFKEFVGQEQITKVIMNEILTGSISHAYLFSGHRGTGKTTLARIFAKAINCQNRQGAEPCNNCPSCKEINEGRAIDLIEVDAASNRGIDEVKSLREGIRFAPTFLKYKVLILDEAHQLSKDATNALLKIMEEPPSYVVFILATTEANKMIPTISSRCQKFNFHKLNHDFIAEKLNIICKAEKIKIEKDALDLLISSADGSLRDAEAKMNQLVNFISNTAFTVGDVREILGIPDINLAIELTDLLAEKQKAKAMKFISDNTEKGLDIADFLGMVIDYLRKIMLLKIGVELIDVAMPSETNEVKEKALKQAELFEEKRLAKTLALLMDAENKTKYSSIPQLPLELAIIESFED
ncbi:MAG: DNA polymerase III subunit gamma/tau [Candidatus Paceibacterota bacterium]